jgi:hypothetical protein
MVKGWQPPFAPSLFQPRIWIICKKRCVLLLNFSLKKSQVTRELALTALSLDAWWLNEIHVEAENELPYYLS